MDVEGAVRAPYGRHAAAVVFQRYVQLPVEEPTVIERSPVAALFQHHLPVVGEDVELLSTKEPQTFWPGAVVVNSRMTAFTAARVPVMAARRPSNA